MAHTDVWKTRLYDAYVSTGQVRLATTPATVHYAPRAPYIRDVIRRHFPVDRSASILDAGCGDGAWLYFLQEEGYRNVTGVDSSVEQIQQARRLGVTNALLGDLNRHLTEAPAASCDAVLLFDILEHFAPSDCLRTLDQVYRVLQPGGRCIVHVPNAEGLFGMSVRYGDFTHEQAFTAQSLSQLLSAAGFRHASSFEDRPIVHGSTTLARRAIWEIGTAIPRILTAAETGRTNCILSRNLLTVALK